MSIICFKEKTISLQKFNFGIEEEEYFIPSYYDPFPLIRTHLNNSYSAKNKLYFKNVLQITNNDTIDDSKTPKIKTHSMSTVSLHKAQKHQKMMPYPEFRPASHSSDTSKVCYGVLQDPQPPMSLS